MRHHLCQLNVSAFLNNSQVCRQLDGLSHFHFTPKPVVLESRVFGSGPESALPSLSLEDIIPSTESSSAMLAPEEVRGSLATTAATATATATADLRDCDTCFDCE